MLDVSTQTTHLEIVSHLMKTISAIYHITAKESEIEAISDDITLEQTVEVPARLVTSPAIWEKVVGKVESIEPLPDSPGRFRVVIRFNLELTGFQIPQLLNLVYGNISIKRNIKLMDIQLPEEYLKHFRGPNFGISGIRRLLGVYERPLLATALKPMGSDVDELAAIARGFSLGGGDIIKDDHNLIDEGFEQFQERVFRCQETVDEANQRTGRRTLYFPNVVAPVDQLNRYVESALRHGISGILISPFLVGLDHVRCLASKYPIIVMAHPSLSGTNFHDRAHGMSPGVLLGKIFRLIGADASIFPNYGGRFSFTRGECHQIGEHLRSPLGSLKPAFPVPDRDGGQRRPGRHRLYRGLPRAPGAADLWRLAVRHHRSAARHRPGQRVLLFRLPALLPVPLLGVGHAGLVRRVHLQRGRRTQFQRLHRRRILGGGARTGLWPDPQHLYGGHRHRPRSGRIPGLPLQFPADAAGRPDPLHAGNRRAPVDGHRGALCPQTGRRKTDPVRPQDPDGRHAAPAPVGRPADLDLDHRRGWRHRLQPDHPVVPHLPGRDWRAELGPDRPAQFGLGRSHHPRLPRGRLAVRPLRRAAGHRQRLCAGGAGGGGIPAGAGVPRFPGRHVHRRPGQRQPDAGLRLSDLQGRARGQARVGLWPVWHLAGHPLPALPLDRRPALGARGPPDPLLDHGGRHPDLHPHRLEQVRAAPGGPSN